MIRLLVLSIVVSLAASFSTAQPWKEHAGKPGSTGWRCHIVCPDPQDHGPDGINFHDWDGDGQLDLFVNYEEGRYSRLFFNPGKSAVRGNWPDFIELKHGKCEDSGIGDLDDDGDVDYIANGGWVYFNPGKEDVRDAASWTKMTLFDNERRVPRVADIDGDGLNDLIVGAQEWYKQPATDKHNASAWTKHTIGMNRWPMHCIFSDVDADGLADMVVPDRGIEICWYKNPGLRQATQPWLRQLLHDHTEPMFMAVADLNNDGKNDFVIAGGNRGKHARKLIILLRTNRTGSPIFKEILIDQPSGNFPKGVAVCDFDNDPTSTEIVVIPQQKDIWRVTYSGDAFDPASWKATPIAIPHAETRKKMDNAFVADIDGDGDLDIATTEENGGWGVIWFENPCVKSARE